MRVSESKTAIQWILVIGVEGTGHHMMRDVLYEFLSQPSVVDKGDYYPLLMQRWEPGNKRLRKEVVRFEMARILKNYEGAGVTHIFEDTSFPFNLPRNPERRPDIIDLIDIISDFVDVRILALYRNPVSTVYSALRRGFSKDIRAEANLTEQNHLFIIQQLSQLEAGRIRTVEFESFVANPVPYLPLLAEWMRFDPELVAGGASRIRPSTSLRQIPQKAKSFLTEFFTPARIDRWRPTYVSSPLLAI